MAFSSANANANTNDGDVAETTSSSGPSLEVDPSEQVDDRDSAFGDSQSSLTMSATSSVFNFRFENGRRYHAYAEGKYPVPNDELKIEADRLDLQHHAFRLTLDGKLYRAPIPSDVQNVLDVGTGTGIWAIEFADEHPSAQVVGTDLSPIQPTAVPPNCQFLIDDCEQEWLFRNQFDFVHTRAMVAAIKDWSRFFEQAYANLKPGGYHESQELTFPIHCMDSNVTPENSSLLRWGTLFTEAAAKTGLDATAPHHLGQKLRNAGFVDIHQRTYKWPLGKWAKGDKMKLLGRYVYADLADWLPSSSLGLFTRVLQWSREEVELFLLECRREMKRKDRHYYANVLFWYARKVDDPSEVYSGSGITNEEELLESDEEARAPLQRSGATGRTPEQGNRASSNAVNMAQAPRPSSSPHPDQESPASVSRSTAAATYQQTQSEAENISLSPLNLDFASTAGNSSGPKIQSTSIDELTFEDNSAKTAETK